MTASFLAFVLVCLGGLPPTSAFSQATRWFRPCRKSVRSMYDTAVDSPYMWPRVACGHAGTGAVAVPSMYVVRDRCTKIRFLYESYEYQNCRIYIPTIRARFRTTLSSEYHLTYSAVSLTRRFLDGPRHKSPTEV